MACLFAMAVFILQVGFLSSSVPVILSDGSVNYAGMCPFRSFCSSSSLQNISDATKTSCCQPCSCSQDCYEVGTCCPDMPNVDGKEPKYECRDLHDFIPQNSFIYSIKTGIAFRVVDDCPNETVSRQFPRCVNATDLDDFIFVSDLKNERIYRNYQCAKCNGVAKVIHWNAFIDECYPIFHNTFQSFEDRDKYILTNCKLFSIQPAAGIGSKSRCISDYTSLNFDFCTSSTMNKTIQDLCSEKQLSTSTLFFGYNNYRLREYPNIFCYFCTINEIKVDSGCAQSVYVINQRTSGVAFTAILYGEEKALDDERRDKHDCNTSTTWDPFIKRCRPFYCQLGSIPAGQRCLPAFGSVRRVVCIINFIITIPPDFLHLTQEISENVDLTMQKMMYTNGIRCGLCERQAYRHKNRADHDIFLQFKFASTDNCSTSDILAWGRFLITQGTMHFQKTYGQDTVDITFKLTLTDTIHDNDREYLHYMYGDICFGALPLVDWMFLDCPFFRLSASDLNNVGLIHLDNTMAIQIHNSSDVAICVHYYISQSSFAVTTKAYITIILLSALRIQLA